MGAPRLSLVVVLVSAAAAVCAALQPRSTTVLFGRSWADAGLSRIQGRTPWILRRLQLLEGRRTQRIWPSSPPLPPPAVIRQLHSRLVISQKRKRMHANLGSSYDPRNCREESRIRRQQYEDEQMMRRSYSGELLDTTPRTSPHRTVNVWVSSPERPGQGQLWQCQSADTGQPPPAHHGLMTHTPDTDDDDVLQEPLLDALAGPRAEPPALEEVRAEPLVRPDRR